MTKLVKFKSYILIERYVNALPKDQDLKARYADEVWNMLQASYADIGGIKGKGFSTKSDIMHIPMWKMVRKNDKLIAVIMYKDTNGRKSVALGTDGSITAKKVLVDLVKNDLKRSYGEKSKAALGLVMKAIPWDILEPFIKTPEEAQRILRNKVLTPLKDAPKPYSKDAQVALEKYPQLEKYAYFRDLSSSGGDKFAFKIMMGTPDRTIK